MILYSAPQASSHTRAITTNDLINDLINAFFGNARFVLNVSFFTDLFRTCALKQKARCQNPAASKAVGSNFAPCRSAVIIGRQNDRSIF